MEVQLEAAKKQLYDRLFVSEMDLAHADFSLAMLVKKGWHSKPWQRRGTIYQQQTAYTTAFVISYARPFTSSHGWPKLPPELVPFDQEEQKLHHDIMTLRHKAIAHSDSELYKITPWKRGDISATLIGAPYPVVTADQAMRLKPMIQKLRAAIGAKLKELVP